MRLNKAVIYLSFLMLTVSAGLNFMQPVQQASASTFGANLNTGYYDGQVYNPDHRRFFFLDGIPYGWQNNPNATTAALFTASVWDYLNDTGPNAVIHQQEYADARASVLINAMMGVQSNDPRYDIDPTKARWQNGVALAKRLFPTWQAMVNAYATPGNPYGGSVNFNTVITSPPTEINGSGIGDPNLPITGDSPSAPRGTAHGDYPDVVFAQLGQFESNYGIIFTHANGKTFSIKKWCGNLIGDETPFPLDWLHVPALNATTPPGNLSGSTSTVLNFSATAQNTGVTPSNGGILSGRVEVNGQPAQVLAQIQFDPLNPGATTAPLPFSYPIPAFTTAGTQFCFYSAVNPRTIAGGEADSAKACYVVGYSSSPAIQGLNGDVHAGGGICGASAPPVGGNVAGNTNAISMGDYVVASSSLISNFKSNGNGGNNDLLLGSNGGYARACRPNLLQVANNGRTPTSPQITPSPTGTTRVDIGTITGVGRPDVYYFDGPLLSISGVAHSKVTIVVTMGDITIDGPVLLDSAPAAPHYVPSLGIIAQGNITINPLVTRVDAYLFSNSTIDTCDPGAVAGSTTCATPQLVVNGFLMANKILFNRIGRSNTSGAQVSEKIVLMPQLYLNPPRFFDDATTTVLQAQGEKPPLY